MAGGMESMTNAPYLLPQARKGYRLGNSQIIDSVVNDGLWDIYNNYHMGMTGENVAQKYGVTREQQDEYAVSSHQKAVQAWKECRFKSQIVPVELPAKKKGEAPVLFDKDEGPREDTSAAALGNLKPVFKKDGTVTAGNASTMNDGSGGGGGDIGFAGKAAGRSTDGPHCGAGHQRHRSGVGDDGAGGWHQKNLGQDGMEAGRR